ncbi:MAG: FGGY-family carbohydrate kinase [Chitinophagaceae bacterium]
MHRPQVILIFDIGKTNKKILVYNQQYEVLFEEFANFEEIEDEDGFPCEDLVALTDWVIRSFKKWKNNPEVELKAINFSAYGASFVLLDEKGVPCFPLYNYLKPFPSTLQKTFYEKNGDNEKFALETASPNLGSLNAGMQLYRLKVEKAAQFKKVKFALHLPQFFSYMLSNNPISEMTSIGCHTALWDFPSNAYHHWVKREEIIDKFPPIQSAQTIAGIDNSGVKIGAGLHDSSAALIPYLKCVHEPFLLISTGTWCISLNPFNQSPLTKLELEKDCLFYISYNRIPVKASRLFAGQEHEKQVRRLAQHFDVEVEYYQQVKFNATFFDKISKDEINILDDFNPHQFTFTNYSLAEFSSYEDAYHRLMVNLVDMQIQSTNLILLNSPVKSIYVDGGFSKNEIFMQILANKYSSYNVYAAAAPNASALGAAMVLHEEWNNNELPSSILRFEPIQPK